jgi:hypothetical protein
MLKRRPNNWQTGHRIQWHGERSESDRWLHNLTDWYTYQCCIVIHHTGPDEADGGDPWNTGFQLNIDMPVHSNILNHFMYYSYSVCFQQMTLYFERMFHLMHTQSWNTCIEYFTTANMLRLQSSGMWCDVLWYQYTRKTCYFHLQNRRWKQSVHRKQW